MLRGCVRVRYHEGGQLVVSALVIGVLLTILARHLLVLKGYHFSMIVT